MDQRPRINFDANDPQETLDVHCGDDKYTSFSPYQSTRLSRYNAVPSAWGRNMQRREFIKLIGGAAAGVATHGACAAAGDAGDRVSQRAVGNAGCASACHVPTRATKNQITRGRNLLMEYRWAEGQYQRLPAMAAELVHHPVSLILAQAPLAALAAKAATATIPIVSVVGFDPVLCNCAGMPIMR